MATSTTVFLHGFSGEGHSLEAFAAAHSGDQALCVDLPGFGAAPIPSKAAVDDFDVYCDETWEHICGQVPNGKIILVGHSYGAMVAFNIARRYAAKISRLDLYCPVAAPKRGPRLIITSVNYANRLNLPPGLLVRLFSNRLIVDAVTTTMLRRQWSAEVRRQIKKMRRHEATLYHPIMFKIMRHSLDFPQLMHEANITVPTRICHVVDDSVAGTHDASWYQARTDVRHVVKTSGGHLAVVAEPQRLGRVFEAQGDHSPML